MSFMAGKQTKRRKRREPHPYAKKARKAGSIGKHGKPYRGSPRDRKRYQDYLKMRSTQGDPGLTFGEYLRDYMGVNVSIKKPRGGRYGRGANTFEDFLKMIGVNP